MSRARNRAIAAAQGDYVILLDGDMVAERHFIADHRAFARHGCFAQGSRVLTDAALGWAHAGTAARSSRSFSAAASSGGDIPCGCRCWLACLPGQAPASAASRAATWAFWRDDLLRLNGFNEAMIGWGREDTELAVRAFHAGLLRRDLRLGALAVHLYHRTRKHARRQSQRPHPGGDPTLAPGPLRARRGAAPGRICRGGAGSSCTLAVSGAAIGADRRAGDRAEQPAVA